MSRTRAIETKKGWWVKADKNGQKHPMDSRLAGIFEEEGVKTLCDAFNYGTDKFHSKECMQTRQILQRKITTSEGRSIEKLKLGDYKAKTYKEVAKDVDKIYHSLRAIGLKPFDRIAIFAETRYEWFLSAMASLKNRATVCTLYSTLSKIGITHALNETDVEIVITSFELLPKLKSIIDDLPSLKKVVIMEDQLEGIGDLEINPKVEFIPFSDLLYNEHPKSFYEIPSPSDIAIIMYTSGSTGTPKGVELDHTSILTSLTGYSVQMNVGSGDRFISFLPLAHIMELATELALISLGACIYYSSPHTLTKKGLKVMEGTEGDAKLAKPTVMNSVPLVLDRIIKGITQAVEDQGWLKSFIFSRVVYYKNWLGYIPFATSLLDMVIFNKVREEIGGCLKRIVVGGAPLAASTHYKMMAIFGCSIQVGYGSTETSSSICGMDEDDTRTGMVGGPNLGVIIKLSDWEEGGYLTSDYPYPRGEIIVGGDVVANGYFKLERETAESFYKEDGIKWFKSGDIGELDRSGTIRIIDRKKDLVKLKHGEYVSLGNSESILKILPFIENLCVFADSTQERTVAIAVPIMEKLMEVAKSLGLKKDDSKDDVLNDPKIKKYILKQLDSHGKTQGLNKWEIPANIYLTSEQWTPDTGLVTAALKLRRLQIFQKYQNMIIDMYACMSN